MEKKIVFIEEQSPGYKARTIKNASADATIAIAVDFNSAGERLTKSSVIKQGKVYIPINANSLEITSERIENIVQKLNTVKKQFDLIEDTGITLNIAGNGIYTMKGRYTQKEVDTFTYELLKQVIESPLLKNKISFIRTGGQTGFDEAGAKTGIRLNLPTTILAPKGWTFRNIDGEDISDVFLFKRRFNDQPEVNIDCKHGWNGACCCNCTNRSVIMKHPINAIKEAIGNITEIMGYGCMAFYKAELSSIENKITFSSSGHGMCELHDSIPERRKMLEIAKTSGKFNI